jgi:uncharacterized membrane protein HdeD (DUF308 family)
MDSIDRFSRYSAQSWKESSSGAVAILIANTILLVFLLTGASLIDLLAIIYLQAIISGVFSAIGILRQKRYRTETRIVRSGAAQYGIRKYIDRALGVPESATYGPLTKQYAFFAFVGLLIVTVLLIGLSIYAIFGFGEVTAAYLVIMGLITIAYEYRERSWKDDRVRTLSKMGFRTFLKGAPLFIIPMLGTFSTGTLMIIGFILIKTFFDLIANREPYYRALIDEWLYEEGE